MKKILCLLFIILVISTFFVACSFKKNTTAAQGGTTNQGLSVLDSTSAAALETEPDTNPQLNGFTIEELQNAVISCLKSKDPDSISEYMLPGYKEALKYAYENFDDDNSVLVDLEVSTMDEVFSKASKDNINYGNTAEYTAEDLYILSEFENDEDKEELESVLSDIKRCLKSSKAAIEITDLTIFEIVAESDEYSLGISAISVKVNDGWYIFAFDC